jgi:hypothetical protein
MNILVALLKEIAGMFLADGRLPVWLVAWIIVVGAAAYEGLGVSWRAALLVMGVFSILTANVLGAARAARKPASGRKG